MYNIKTIKAIILHEKENLPIKVDNVFALGLNKSDIIIVFVGRAHVSLRSYYGSPVFLTYANIISFFLDDNERQDEVAVLDTSSFERKVARTINLFCK